MNTINRRDFLRWVGATGIAASAAPWVHAAKGGANVVVIGGGFGGATCAKYLRRLDPALHVTLVTAGKTFVTCPFSNMVLGGLRKIDSITHNYNALSKQYGVKVVVDTATKVDPAGKKVTLKSGKTLSYDKLVLSPGIDFKWDSIAGYSAKASEKMPHAWQAGSQTLLLRKQLEAMKDGGTVIIAAPGNPFRCPPGPYERASMIAHYLKQHKPKSKVLLLDAKDKFSKQGLFEAGWKQVYPGMIEWVSSKKGGLVDKVDVKSMTVYAGADKHKAAVANIIPAQKAGAIAFAAGVTDDSGWCPVNQGTFESTKQKDIHVIGDASIAGAMPKSGFAANSEAKVCAAAIVSALHGQTPPTPSYINTCYSLIAPDYGISVAMVYELTDKGIAGVKGAGGVSPKDADTEFRKKEAQYDAGWYDSITSDIWG